MPAPADNLAAISPPQLTRLLAEFSAPAPKPDVDFGARDRLRQDFLTAQGLAETTIVPLASDASFRRYYRLPEKKLLVMDSPPHLYPTKTFAKVQGLLADLHTARLAAIVTADHKNGFLLLEDLGEASLNRLLTQDPARGEDYYRQVVAGLVAMQMAWCRHYSLKPWTLMPPVPIYDGAVLAAEAMLLPQWYLPSERDITPSAAAVADFLRCLLVLYELLMAHRPPPQLVLVHRDFHVDNLLLVEGRVAWLDFQDALLGHPAYDMMSLLEDARRDLAPAMQEKLWREFVTAWQVAAAKKFPDLNGDFLRWFYFLGLTRHAKVLGIFIRLEKRDGKKNYRQHLPRVLRLLQNSMVSLLAITAADEADKKNGLTAVVKKLDAIMQEWQIT